MDSNSQIHLNILEGVQMPMIQSTSETVEMMEVGTQQILREDSIVKPLLSTPKKKHRSRLLPKISSLTPNCRRMYKEYRKSRRQLDFRKRTQRALKFSKDQSFLNMTKNMNPLAQKLFWMQIKQANKNIKGRRFSDEEKLIALSILKQSPKCYRFLQKMFILPSKTTLNKVVASLDVTSGINLKIFEALKLEVETWPELRKFCSILFDEVALEAGLTYDKNRDKIHGFVERICRSCIGFFIAWSSSQMATANCVLFLQRCHFCYADERNNTTNCRSCGKHRSSSCSSML
ncbi:unnamed protein product [Parnassius mnemosyne]|uniref:Recombination activating protein 1 n=1 Tax=Parnassius mnemosyne TaxID=213953 RepID=A0AAV1M4J4_9NEOP